MLSIKNLSVSINDEKILENFNLEIKKGETHIIMGPNGSGKSTLCYAIMGHPKYKITSGKIEFNGQNILEMPTDERARAGLFLAFQYPKEVPGITFGNFLRQSSNVKLKESGEKVLSPMEYFKIAKELIEKVDLDKSMIGRGVNEGFSGGEKKRAEIVQMAALKPKLSLIDEIDSGLDIDSLKKVAQSIEEIKSETGMSTILITHYQRLLNYMNFDFIHIMKNGKIVKTGGKELVEDLEKNGYQNF